MHLCYLSRTYQIGDISLAELSHAVPRHDAVLEKSMKEALSVNLVRHADAEGLEMEDDYRIESLVASLMKKMPTSTGGLVNPKVWPLQKSKMYHEAERLRSKSFGAEVKFRHCPRMVQ